MTIFGSDVSHYDAADTRAMFTEGIAFQTHKAGGDANDAELATWWNYVKGYRDRVLLGAYWVLYPGSPASRAGSFVSRLDSQCPGWRDGPFILQADCEKWNGDAATVPSVAEVNAFCDALVKSAPKLVPIAYMPDWVYGDLSALRYPLWSSKYVGGNPAGYKAMYPGDSSSKWAAYGGKTPAVLQYTSSATIGGQTTCDANAFRGTLAELTALLAPGWMEDLVAQDITRDWLVKMMHQLIRGNAGTNDDGTGGIVVDGVRIGGGDAVQRWSAAGGDIATDDPNPTMSVSSGFRWTGGPLYQVRDTINAMSAALAKVLDNVVADDGEKAEILAAIAAAKDETVTGVLEALGRPDTSPEDVATALVSLLGKDRAASVAAALAALAQ